MRSPEMPCALRAGLALYIMICGFAWAQDRKSPPSKKTAGITAEALRPGSTIRYGRRQWKLIRQIKATFNPLPDPCQILLLESLESTGTSGAGQSLNDAELLIQYGDSILYDYAKKERNNPEAMERTSILTTTWNSRILGKLAFLKSCSILEP